ncbi:MAG: PIG-L family deacetylase [candidate division KSB1 bacterium]|nr:PIG-L family deacetylase [candidate division KSB1 bacterium]MDZ7312091.1 PIG-L family deacetylase [candidate division KSB1 bacterium]
MRHIKNRYFLAYLPFTLYYLLFATCSPLFAQPTTNDLRLHQALLDATNGVTLMSVAAHPDDEDIEAVTYYRQKFGARVVIVVASRGEGGQNEIGPELYEDLAVIRSEEMRRAEAISGGEYYNLNFVDFGFSKKIEETYEKWGKQEILRRLVQKIRELQPDVIITNHDTSTGHGHHQAIGQQLLRAFFAAGDPKQFPEQLRAGLKIWQPSRLFWRVHFEKPANVVLQGGEVHPLRGQTYAQIAAEALSQHKSQGMDKFASLVLTGKQLRYYQLILMAPNRPPLADSNDLFSGLQDEWQSEKSYTVDTRAEWEKLKQLRNQSSPSREEIVLTGHRLLTKLSRLKFEDSRRLERLQELMAAALGVDGQIRTRQANWVPGERYEIESHWRRATSFSNSTPSLAGIDTLVQCRGYKIYVNDKLVIDSKRHFTLPANGEIEFSDQVHVPKETPWTVPRQQVIYLQSRLPEPVWGIGTFSWRGVEFSLRRVASAREGEIQIVPPLQVESTRLPLVVLPSRQNEPVKIPVRLINHLPRPQHLDLTLSPALTLTRTPTLTLTPLTRTFDLSASADSTIVLDYFVPAGEQNGPGWSQTLQLEVNNRCLRTNANLAPSVFPSTLFVVRVETLVPSELRVGLVASYDTTLAWALRQLRIPFSKISDSDLAAGNFHEAQTLIVDMRAYLIRSKLREHNQKLLDWVADGGHLVVMYHKTFEWNPATNPAELRFGNMEAPATFFSPYRLRLGSERVTAETAPVKMLTPRHPIFNFPNVITAADWEGWVQERGLYFPQEWDERFVPLVEMADPGEPPLRGGMLLAQYGAGTYLYTSLVWYRQLRAPRAASGAFRMLVNMLASP